MGFFLVYGTGSGAKTKFSFALIGVLQVPPKALSLNKKERMNIQLWYSQEMKEWRWSLISEEDKRDQHTGGQEDLRDAMNDVANTVEFLLDKGNI